MNMDVLLIGLVVLGAIVTGRLLIPILLDLARRYLRWARMVTNQRRGWERAGLCPECGKKPRPGSPFCSEACKVESDMFYAR